MNDENDSTNETGFGIDQALTLSKKNRLSVNGRKTVLSDALTIKICEWLRRGNYLETACKGNGVDKSTLYRWLDCSNDEALTDEQREPFIRFREAIETAQAFAQDQALNMLLDHGRNDPRAWQANAWFLERRNRQQWGKHDSLTVDGKMSLTELITQSIRDEANDDGDDETTTTDEPKSLTDGNDDDANDDASSNAATSGNEPATTPGNDD